MLSAAPSTHFAVGYSTVVGEEDEVNSPPPRIRLPVISSPSPLRPRRILNSFDDDGRRSSRGKKILCSSEGPPPPAQCSTVCYLTPSPPSFALSIFLCSVVFFCQGSLPARVELITNAYQLTSLNNRLWQVCAPLPANDSMNRVSAKRRRKVKSKLIAGSNLVTIESEMPSIGTALPVLPTQVGSCLQFSHTLILIFISSLNELSPSSFNAVHDIFVSLHCFGVHLFVFFFRFDLFLNQMSCHSPQLGST